MNTFATISGRANNLNAVRLMLALMVMITHSIALSYGSADGDPLKRLTRGQENCGSIAVDLFFLLSGMLITASWLRSKSMSDFFLRRVLRIYPGFIVAISFSALLTWLLSPEFRQHAGTGHQWAHDFLNDAITLDNNSMNWDGTFAGNPWPGSANGSLWTIHREFNCYLTIAVIGLFCLFKRRFLVLLATITVSGDFIWGILHSSIRWGPLQTNDSEHLATRFTSYFLLGAVAWLFRDKITSTPLFAGFCLATLSIAALFAPAFSVLFLPGGSYLALWIGLSNPWRLTHWTQKTDISYGVYLYPWPVQQVIARFPPFRSAATNLLLSVPTTVALAFLSWHLIESRFLKMKSLVLTDHDPAIEQLEAVHDRYTSTIA